MANNDTARAAVFDGAGRPWRIVEVPLPARLGPGEVLVRIALATICGSDLHTIQGRRVEPTPSVLGHEAIGTVVRTGAGRETWLGRRVTWTLADSCGECAACVEFALPQKCARIFKYGHAPLRTGEAASELSGTYSTHIILRKGTSLVALPEWLPEAVAAPANCALATMIAVTEQLPRPCRVAVIQGAGLLGLYGCALLRAAGVERVIVVDTDGARLARAESAGGEPALASALTRLDPGRADLVVEVAGEAGVVAEGIRLLRPGGHYLLAGLVHPDSALGLTGEAVIRGCVTLRGTHNYAPRHLEAAVDFLARRPKLPLAEWVSPPLPLEEIAQAVALAATRRWPRVALTMAG